MIEEQKRQFFSKMKRKPTTIKGFSGKVSLSNFPKEERTKILNRLAEKDGVLSEGLKGVLPGIKIDGREVTKENIHEFEINNLPKEAITTKVLEEKPKNEVTLEKIVEVKKYSKVELKAMNKDEQVEILNKLNVKKIPRLEKDRIDLIFKLQK